MQIWWATTLNLAAGACNSLSLETAGPLHLLILVAPVTHFSPALEEIPEAFFFPFGCLLFELQ